jgi:hypothetical protein
LPCDVEAVTPIDLVYRTPVTGDLKHTQSAVDEFTDRMKGCIRSVRQSFVEVARLLPVWRVHRADGSRHDGKKNPHDRTQDAATRSGAPRPTDRRSRSVGVDAGRRAERERRAGGWRPGVHEQSLAICHATAHFLLPRRRLRNIDVTRRQAAEVV